MESYAVFEGGGVKGLAFAGALKAAEEASIKFVGYGGALLVPSLLFSLPWGLTVMK